MKDYTFREKDEWDQCLIEDDVAYSIQRFEESEGTAVSRSGGRKTVGPYYTGDSTGFVSVLWQNPEGYTTGSALRDAKILADSYHPDVAYEAVLSEDAGTVWNQKLNVDLEPKEVERLLNSVDETYVRVNPDALNRYGVDPAETEGFLRVNTDKFNYTWTGEENNPHMGLMTHTVPHTSVATVIADSNRELPVSEENRELYAETIIRALEEAMASF